MYNTHPKLCYKILGKKVRIILEILRYFFVLYFVYDSYNK